MHPELTGYKIKPTEKELKIAVVAIVMGHQKINAYRPK